MKEFKIDQNQLQGVLNVLAEFPAKQVIQAIDLLRSLPEIVVPEVVEKKQGE